MYNMFIDDERYPSDKDERKYTIVRSSADAIYLTKTFGIPEYISFDHDLGCDDTAIKYVNWLIEYMLDNKLYFPNGFSFYVHSQNPVGAQLIKNKMDNFIHYLIWKGH